MCADSHGFLFSLPTIADALPALDPVATSGRFLELGEDDWCQTEFRHRSEMAALERQLAAIRQVLFEEHVVLGPGIAFRRCLPRQLDPPAFDVCLEDLRRSFPQARPYDGIRISFLEGGLVRGGFAMETPDGVLLYGNATRDGRVHMLGIQLAYPDPASLTPSDEAMLRDRAGRLERLALDHDLVVAKWCHASVMRPGSRELAAWLGLPDLL